MINPEWLNAPYAIGLRRVRSGFGEQFDQIPIIYQRMTLSSENIIAGITECYDHLHKDITPLPDKDAPRILVDGKVVFKNI